MSSAARAASGLAALAALAAGCGPQPARPEARPTVFVSILPQRALVEAIAGETVAVEVLVGPGESPATYEPTPRQMAALAEAALYVRIGVPFERTLLDKLRRAVPGLVVVDGAAGVTLEHGGHHGGPDPHFWLDPLLVEPHVAIVCEALCRLDPDHAADYRDRLAAFRVELEAVDARIAARLAPLHGRTLYVAHPAYGYFARRYGLHQAAVAAEGKAPAARRLAELVDRARADGVGAIFVQPQFSSDAVEAIAEAIGARVVPIDPLAPDYLANLERMADRIAAAYGVR